MGPADQVQLVLPQEVEDNVRSKHEADPSFGLAPHFDCGFGVSPEEVAEETGVGNVGGSHDGVDLIHGDEVGREAPVHAEDFVFDEGSNWEAVEAVDEGFPEFDIVAGFA